MLYHYLVNEFVAKASSKNVKKISKVPVAIIVFGLTLTTLSLFHYFKNAALRKFAMKTIKDKIESVRITLRGNVSGRPIPNWMSLRTLNQPTSLSRPTQNTKMFVRRKRSKRVQKMTQPVNIVLEDMSDYKSPTVQS